MVTIVNLRNTKCNIKVDRSSPLGNPFVMHSESERDSVCDKYEVWLVDQITNKNPAVCNELNRLYQLAKSSDITIGCWCVPKRCHASFIADLINNLIVPTNL